MFIARVVGCSGEGAIRKRLDSVAGDRSEEDFRLQAAGAQGKCLNPSACLKHSINIQDYPGYYAGRISSRIGPARCFWSALRIAEVSQHH